MNVRFFGGTRAQYDSLAAPRNPMGLYFCADTRELFWGDKLLTDGTRIVRTEADLPSLAQAADGITYFVEETRNGYVISSNRTKWIQVIHAPNDGGTIKAISFAGIEMEEVDGVFTIDRRCAREALGFIVPDGLEDEEIVIATEDFVKDEIAKIEIPGANLDNYYTKVETAAAIEEAINNLELPEISLDDYATKQDVSEAIASISPVVEEVKTKLETEVLPKVEETILPTVQKVENDILPILPTVKELTEKAATQDWVKEQGYLTDHQDLSAYAKKTDLDELATIESVEALADTLESTNSQLDRVTRATESLQETVGTLKIPTKVSELDNDAGYLTEHQDLSEYAKKSEIPSVEGLASEEFVLKKIAEAELADQDVDLSAYYTKSEVDALIPEVPTKVSELTNDAGYITAADVPATDLSNYYNKTETENLIAEAVESIEHPIVDLEGYATEEWVNEQGFLKEHQDLSEYAKKSDIPEAELFVVDFTAPDFAAALEAYNNGKLLLLVNAAPDANGYAVMNYVRADLITFTKFLTSRSEAYGSFNTYYLHSDNTWEISKEVKLNKVEANVADEPTAELTSLRVGKEVYKLPDLANYVTNEILEQNYITQEEIANTYVTENHIVNNYVTQEAAKNTYVTNEQVTEVVTNEVNTVVTEQIETKVETIIQEKVDTGEIKVNSISYGEF